MGQTAYQDHEAGSYGEAYGKLNVGNIIPFEVKVMAAVANDDFSTIDLRKTKNVLGKEPFLLDDNFVKGFEGKEPQWGELGWFTFKRTYARRVEKADGTSSRTEEWTEVVRRVVEGNLSILPEDPLTTQEYGQNIYTLIWNLVFTPPGRGLWMSGSEFAKKSGDAMNNCLRGSERVFVKDVGLVPISELHGETEVLSDGGVYRTADFRSFGVQDLMKITFKDGQEVFATPEHKWILLSGNSGERKKDRVNTKDLQAGDKVPIIRADVPSKIDEEGLAKVPYKEIKSIEHTGIREEVFCCNEPETHSFVIEGHLLTGNCWYVATRPWHYGETTKIFDAYEIDPQEQYPSYPFVFMFDMAMKGGGVGFSVEDEDIALLPAVRNKMKIAFRLDTEHADFAEVKAMADSLGAMLNEEVSTSDYYFAIRDMREGWAEALAITIDEHFRRGSDDVSWVFDLSKIRKRGTPIRGFGGVASGSAPLLLLLAFTNDLLNKFMGTKLNSEAGTDLQNAVGKCVIAGNVRRTAQVALASPYDQSFIDLKNYTLYSWLGGWRDRGDGVWEQYENSDEELLAQGYAQEAIDEARYQVFAQQNHRWASNNSVVIDDPRGYRWGFISPGIEANGEPGILNRWLMQNFGRVIDGFRKGIDKSRGGNPCMEIPLESGEPCNLTELFLPVMHKLGIDASEVLPLMVHYTKRVTFSPYEWELSREVITRNRRLGVSFSGFADWVLMKYGKGAIIGWSAIQKADWHDMIWLDGKLTDCESYVTFHPGNVPPAYDPETQVIEPHYNPALVEEIDRMYKIVKQADVEYSAVLTKALGYLVEPSIKLTTVKPSGTVALLPFVSPGVHHHYFRYGIRRIQVQSNDPLLGLAQLAGYHAEPYNKSPETTSVIEFPVEAPTAGYTDFRDCSEVTIEEQFALQALLCVYWADNMVSCTITFQENEKPKIKHLLEQYRMRIKSTSLLPYSGHGFVQAPYTPFEWKDGKSPKEQYEEARKPINFTPHELYHILMSSEEGFEDREMTLSEALECASGVCPSR